MLCIKKSLIEKEVCNRYKLLKLLKCNAFSDVYLAEETKSHEMRIVKVYMDADSRTSNAALAEAAMMKTLNHKEIPFLEDVLDDEQHLFIVTEYVEGETLDEILSKFGPQPEEIVVEWAKQICSILTYLHTLKPPHIYRDVKPANLILTPGGKIKLIDFSIMRTYDPNKTRDEIALGTRGYVSPEGFQGQTDPRSDIYSLGVTMNQLVTGADPQKPPYILKSIRQDNPSLSKGLEYIINKCTEPFPENRYQSSLELFTDLNLYQNLPKNAGDLRKRFKKKGRM